MTRDPFPEWDCWVSLFNSDFVKILLKTNRGGNAETESLILQLVVLKLLAGGCDVRHKILLRVGW